MTVASDARLSSLDRMLDDSQVGETFATDMFGVVDALDSSPTLRRAVTDPGTPEGARRALVHGLLDGKVDRAVADFVAEAATLRWAGGRTFAAALERQAVRAVLIVADRRRRTGGHRGPALPIRPVRGVQPRSAQRTGGPLDRPQQAAGTGRRAAERSRHRGNDHAREARRGRS